MWNSVVSHYRKLYAVRFNCIVSGPGCRTQICIWQEATARHFCHGHKTRGQEGAVTARPTPRLLCFRVTDDIQIFPRQRYCLFLTSLLMLVNDLDISGYRKAETSIAAMTRTKTVKMRWPVTLIYSKKCSRTCKDNHLSDMQGQFHSNCPSPQKLHVWVLLELSTPCLFLQ